MRLECNLTEACMSHRDALGYLSDLNNEVALPWFGMICDLAAGGTHDLTAADLDVLFAVFVGNAFCETLRLLASPGTPTRPLKNVRSAAGNATRAIASTPANILRT